MKDFTCVLLLTGLVFSTSTAQNAGEKLVKLYADAWEMSARPSPFDTTHARLADISRAAIDYRAQWWESALDTLLSIAPDQLSREDRISYDVFRYWVEDEIAYYRFKAYLLPFDAEGGFHTAFGFLPGNTTCSTQSECENYIAQLEDFDRLVRDYIAMLDTAILKGYTLPSVILEDFDQTAMAYVSDSIEQSIFYRPLLTLPESDWVERVRTRGRQAIADHVNPGYRKLADFLREQYIPAGRTSIGAKALPQGEAYYAQRVAYYSTLPLTPQEIYETGLKEVERIRTEMESILLQLGYSDGLEAFQNYLRSDPRFYAASPHALLAEASYVAKHIDGKLPEYFATLPRLTYGVAPVPAEIAPRYTSGRYAEGSYARHQSGTYWVNTWGLESRPLYALPALTLHEAVPGHHLQIALAEENAIEAGDAIPEFRRTIYISAFGEGWALYAEWLGKEMGIYEDLYQQYGALTYEMWRACRLVVDPGMHVMGWDRQKAVDFMAANTALSMREIENEVNRYIGWPGQAVSYKIGEMKIRELRSLAEEKLGPQFDIRTFHDQILAHGSVPLSVLERIIRAWIDQESKSKE